MRIMFYSLTAQAFRFAGAPGDVAVPGLVYEEFMDDQRTGRPMEVAANGMPLVVANLLTLKGLQTAVAREVKTEAATINNVLVGLGFEALTALMTASASDPNRATYQAVLAAVLAARSFVIKGILTDPEVLAVQPGTGPGQGAAVLKDLIYGKWKAYAASAPSVIKTAFAEVA